MHIAKISEKFRLTCQHIRKDAVAMSRKRSLGVIGLGHVGAHVAYTLAVQGIADELVLVDQNAQKRASEVQDLRAACSAPERGWIPPAF